MKYLWRLSTSFLLTACVALAIDPPRMANPGPEVAQMGHVLHAERDKEFAASMPLVHAWSNEQDDPVADWRAWASKYNGRVHDPGVTYDLTAIGRTDMLTLSNAVAHILKAWHTGDAGVLLSTADDGLRHLYAQIGYRADGSGTVVQLPYTNLTHAVWVTTADTVVGGVKYYHVDIRRQHPTTPHAENVHFMSMMFKESGHGLVATDDIATLGIAQGFVVGGLTVQMLPMHMGAYTNLLEKFRQTEIPAAVYTVKQGANPK